MRSIQARLYLLLATSPAVLLGALATSLTMVGGCAPADDELTDSSSAADTKNPTPPTPPAAKPAKKDDWGFDKIDFCLRAFVNPKVDPSTSSIVFQPDQSDYETADDARKANMRVDPNNVAAFKPDCDKPKSVAMRKCKMKDGTWQTLTFTPDQKLSQEGMAIDDKRIEWRKDARTAFHGEAQGESCSARNAKTGFGGDGLHCGGKTEHVTTYTVSVNDEWQGKLEGNIGLPLGPAGVGVSGGITITNSSGSGITQNFTQVCQAEQAVAGAGCSCATISCKGQCDLGTISNLAVMRTCHFSYRITSNNTGAEAATQQGSKRFGNTAIQVAKVSLNDVVGPAKLEKLTYKAFGCADNEDALKSQTNRAPDGTMVAFCGQKVLECKVPTPEEQKKLDDSQKRLNEKAPKYGFLCTPDAPAVAVAAPTPTPAATTSSAALLAYATAKAATRPAPTLIREYDVAHQEIAIATQPTPIQTNDMVIGAAPPCSSLYTWSAFVDAYGDDVVDFSQPFTNVTTAGWVDQQRVLTILTGDAELPVAPLLVKQHQAPSNEITVDWIGSASWGGATSTSVKVLPNGGLHIVPAVMNVLRDGSPTQPEASLDLEPGDSLDTILARMDASTTSDVRTLPTTVLAIGRTVGVLRGISPSLADTLRAAPMRVRVVKQSDRLSLAPRK